MAYQQPPYPQQPPFGQQAPFPQGALPPMGFFNAQGAQPGYPQPGYPQPGYANPTPPYYSGYNDAEGGESDHNVTSGFGDGTTFSDKNIRRGFIRKVYGILMCQLLVTMIIIIPFVYHQPTRQFAQQNRWFYWVSYAFVFIMLLVLGCCPSFRMKTPQNYLALVLLTAAEGMSLGCVCSMFRADSVLISVGITAAVCLALTLFAFQSKWDFTAMGGILVACATVLLLFGIIAIFIRSPIVNLVYASLGALLFSVYIVYDTQMLLGGKHKYSVSPEDYIGAVLSLYIDIVNLFVMILSLVGSSRD